MERVSPVAKSAVSVLMDISDDAMDQIMFVSDVESREGCGCGEGALGVKMPLLLTAYAMESFR